MDEEILEVMDEPLVIFPHEEPEEIIYYPKFKEESEVTTNDGDFKRSE